MSKMQVATDWASLANFAANEAGARRCVTGTSPRIPAPVMTTPVTTTPVTTTQVRITPATTTRGATARACSPARASG